MKHSQARWLTTIRNKQTREVLAEVSMQWSYLDTPRGFMKIQTCFDAHASAGLLIYPKELVVSSMDTRFTTDVTVELRAPSGSNGDSAPRAQLAWQFHIDRNDREKSRRVAVAENGGHEREWHSDGTNTVLVKDEVVDARFRPSWNDIMLDADTPLVELEEPSDNASPK